MTVNPELEEARPSRTISETGHGDPHPTRGRRARERVRLSRGAVGRIALVEERSPGAAIGRAIHFEFVDSRFFPGHLQFAQRADGTEIHFPRVARGAITGAPASGERAVIAERGKVAVTGFFAVGGGGLAL